MTRRLSAALQQWTFLLYELKLIANRRKWRYFSLLFSGAFHVVAAYRIERSLYLLLGAGWKVARVALAPLLFLARPWLPASEIHYEAQIDKGLKILHPSLGEVISARAVIGRNLTLTGGNCIGTRAGQLREGRLQIGNEVLLGANAVILGPVRIGDRVIVSAGSVALRDIEADEIVGGVPAQTLMRTK